LWQLIQMMQSDVPYGKVPSAPPAQNTNHNDPNLPQQAKYHPVGDPGIQPVNAAGNLPAYKPTYNDLVFGIAFLIHLAGMGYLCYFYGNKIDWQNLENVNETDLYFGVGIIAAGMCSALLWMQILKSMANTIIKIMLIGHVLMWALWAGILLAAGSVIGAIICGLFAALSYFYYWCVRRRIPFATACLELGIEVVKSYPAVIYTALVAVFFQAAWIAVWCIGVYGYADQQDEMSAGVVFALILSLYWTLEVVKYVVHCTASGVTAAWYFTPDSHSPTMGSLKRALTTSFGSICFGALLISIIKTLRSMLNRAARESRRSNVGVMILICMARCMLNCLNRAAELFNEFGFAYVAIYGYAYCDSCQQVMELFRRKGWTAIINEDLVHMALACGAILAGLVIGGVAAAYAALILDNDNYALYGSMGLVFGFFMTWVVLHTITSAITTIFVIWVDDPSIMMHTRPAEAQKLQEATSNLRNRNQAQNNNRRPPRNNDAVGRA